MNYKKLFKKYKYLILAIVVITITILLLSYLRNNCIEPFVCSVDSKELYDGLMKDFDVIFPDRNRNSGGGQFYDHIVNEIQPNYREFLEYNKMYCAVSGSPIDPGRQDPFKNIVIESVDGSKYYGKQYICCSPCVCDMVKYVQVETHEYRGNQIVVFVIDDPCSNESDIPDEVSAFECENGKTKNGVHTKSGRLIVGLLHDPELYDSSNPKHTDAEKDVDKLCESRNSMEPDELQGGMGDIFVKLSLVGKKPSKSGHSELKNIYGEPLHKCKTGDSPGSWDSEGYCSERGGGVHQICFNVDERNRDFSKDTGQSNWSHDRVGNNHCMCLGAWALYKAKNKGTNDELVCESIPDMALSKDYINNWNTWNGNELDDQIVAGVDSLVKQCYYKRPTEHLKEQYDKLRSEYGNWESVI